MPTLLATVFVLTFHGRLVAADPLPILQLAEQATDPAAIDYDALPRLPGKLAVVNPATYSPDYKPGEKLELNRMRLQLHSYLAYHDGKFWCIWSDGPRIEDWPTQEVKYATSEDGITWSEARPVTGTPTEPYGYIARGLWIRDGELLALAAHYKGHGAFGTDKELELRAFVWEAPCSCWKPLGKIYTDAINNFPPQRLPDGNWILTRRDSRFNVSMLIGGRERIDQWESFPTVRADAVPGFRPDEPIIWLQPDNTLTALFRDNGGSQRLFHSTSHDFGKTWATPRPTNFPNATSKLFSMKTSRGYRVLVSNANPNCGRRHLHLSVSPDGITFNRMAKLDIPSPPPPPGFQSIWKKFSQDIASVQYPHVIEHEGNLWIAFSRCKAQIEVFRVSLDAIDMLQGQSSP